LQLCCNNAPVDIIYRTEHQRHHGTELKDGAITPSFERPERAERIRQALANAGFGRVLREKAHPRACLVAAHSERYIHFLETAWDAWAATGRTHDALPLVWPVRELAGAPEPDFIDGKLGFFAMDAGAPINAQTWEAAQGSAWVALTALDRVLAGERSAFALCRPPGHHAGREYAGGYCYLNNAAIAAEQARAQGAAKVAILDVDFHHGNGTQNIFYDRADVFFASLHGDPRSCYPYFSGHVSETGMGAGWGFNANYPLPRGTDWASYEVALDHALKRLSAFAPDLLVVSLGVDTFEHDPISHFRLRSSDYLLLGQALARLCLPTLVVMEGGYLVDELGLNVLNTLQGFEGG